RGVLYKGDCTVTKIFSPYLASPVVCGTNVTTETIALCKKVVSSMARVSLLVRSIRMTVQRFAVPRPQGTTTFNICQRASTHCAETTRVPATKRMRYTQMSKVEFYILCVTALSAARRAGLCVINHAHQLPHISAGLRYGNSDNKVFVCFFLCCCFFFFFALNT
ncbi:unnamed protein product, partial [Lymnaea stagnalis]